jgi:hypothetical protein
MDVEIAIACFFGLLVLVFVTAGVYETSRSNPIARKAFLRLAAIFAIITLILVLRGGLNR